MHGEPEYVDQVPRKLEYEAAHPETEILYIRPRWQAIIREDGGETVVVRTHLQSLMDKLEELALAGIPGSRPVLGSRPAGTPLRPGVRGRGRAPSISPPWTCARPHARLTLRR